MVICQDELVPDPDAALSAYEIGDITGVAPAGGTAGRTWKVSAASGEYFLRLRGARTSSSARLRYDHGLRDHLIRAGVGTAASVASRDGQRWLRLTDGVYELYPFVVGRQFDPTSEVDVTAAGRALARYHQAAATFEAPSAAAERVAQYTRLGFSDATSDRMDDPQLQLATLTCLMAIATTPAQRVLVEASMARVTQLCDEYAGAAYDRLTGWVIHGDYTPANLLFDTQTAGDVAIFDLDWALPGARSRDVGDGLYFFGCCPRQVDAADIWSLTAAGQLDEDRCSLFLRAYAEAAPLSAEELDEIPHAFAGRWFSIRLEGMAKVEAAERFDFYSRDVLAPVQWLDRAWSRIRERI